MKELQSIIGASGTPSGPVEDIQAGFAGVPVWVPTRFDRCSGGEADHRRPHF